MMSCLMALILFSANAQDSFHLLKSRKVCTKTVKSGKYKLFGRSLHTVAECAKLCEKAGWCKEFIFGNRRAGPHKGDCLGDHFKSLNTCRGWSKNTIYDVYSMNAFANPDPKEGDRRNGCPISKVAFNYTKGAGVEYSIHNCDYLSLKDPNCLIKIGYNDHRHATFCCKLDQIKSGVPKCLKP